MAETSFYVLFHNHTEGMELYRCLKTHGFAVRISPAPRAAAAGCGMSLLVSRDEIEAVRTAIWESGIDFERIVELENQIDPYRDRYC